MKKIFLITLLFLSLPSFAQEKVKSYGREGQNKLVEKIASEALTDKDMSKRGYLIMRYDTLGALVLGLSNKQIGFSSPVKFVNSEDVKLSPIEEKMQEKNIPPKGKVYDYNLIYPGLYVWIEDNEDNEGEKIVIL